MSKKKTPFKKSKVVAKSTKREPKVASKITLDPLKYTREEWMLNFIKNFCIPHFKKAGHEFDPKIRVSVGMPFGSRGSKKAIGQYWGPQANADGIGCIFIAPTLIDGTVVLDTIVHELCHHKAGTKAKHGPLFRKVALAVGLEGQMKSAGAGPQLKAELEKYLKKTKPYPHGQLNLAERPTKAQKNRQIKMHCSECGYIARTTKTNLLNWGPVLCPCNKKPMLFELPPDDGEEKE